jgi:thiol-disulfide isomerase/thioredoxin
MRPILLAFIALIVSFTSYGQSGYKLDFQIRGLKDTTAYLGFYYGESTYIKDTARVDSQGKFTFSNTKPLERGMYFLVLDKTRLFDFLIGRQQQFSIQTSTTNYVLNMKVQGDLDNQLFLENLLFNNDKNDEIKPYIPYLNDSLADKKRREEARGVLERINKEVVEYQKGVIAKHPNSLMATLHKANMRVEVPEAPILANGRVDSTFSYRYYKNHYWENFDLGDEALLRLPGSTYRKKLDYFLDNVVIQQSDSLRKEILAMAKVAKRTNETYRFMVWNTILKYQNHEIMGLDAVFVFMYDTYFASGEMDFWANESLKKNLKDRADILRRSLIGQTAPNMIMLNEDLKPKSLYDIKNKYTIVYFYDPDCGFCKKETPKLRDFYKKTKFDVEVFAVCSDTSMVKMKKYINEIKAGWVNVNGPRTYTGPYHDQYDAVATPTLYVLDDRKKIIGKKVPAEKLEEFLGRYEEFNKKK